jgi:hypothetical protein
MFDPHFTIDDGSPAPFIDDYISMPIIRLKHTYKK